MFLTPKVVENSVSDEAHIFMRIMAAEFHEQIFHVYFNFMILEKICAPSTACLSRSVLIAYNCAEILFLAAWYHRTY